MSDFLKRYPKCEPDKKTTACAWRNAPQHPEGKSKRFWLCFLAGVSMELGKSKYNGSMELLLLRGWNAGEEMAALRAKTEPTLHEIKGYFSNAI